MERLLDWKEVEVAQVGLVVKDINFYIKKYWDEYKVGPWNVYTYGGPSHQDTFVREQTANYSMKLALAYVGDMQIELIEPLDEESIYAEFIRERGEGLHHILLGNVTNVREFIQTMQDKGVPPLQRGNFQGRKYTYMDTEKDLGIILEFLEASGPRPNPDYSYPLQNAEHEKAEAIQKGTVFDWKGISQIGLVVNDLDECVKTYSEKYQLGPWEVYSLGGDRHQDTFVGEESTNYSMKFALTKIGKTRLKLIQPNDTNSIYSEFLKTKGRGFHHIQLADVKEVSKAINILNERGVDILQRGNFNRITYTYMNTEKDLAALIEFVEYASREPDDVSMDQEEEN